MPGSIFSSRRSKHDTQFQSTPYEAAAVGQPPKLGLYPVRGNGENTWQYRQREVITTPQLKRKPTKVKDRRNGFRPYMVDENEEDEEDAALPPSIPLTRGETNGHGNGHHNERPSSSSGSVRSVRFREAVSHYWRPQSPKSQSQSSIKTKSKSKSQDSTGSTRSGPPVSYKPTSKLFQSYTASRPSSSSSNSNLPSLMAFAAPTFSERNPRRPQYIDIFDASRTHNPEVSISRQKGRYDYGEAIADRNLLLYGGSETPSLSSRGQRGSNDSATESEESYATARSTGSTTHRTALSPPGTPLADGPLPVVKPLFSGRNGATTNGVVHPPRKSSKMAVDNNGYLHKRSKGVKFSETLVFDVPKFEVDEGSGDGMWGRSAGASRSDVEVNDESVLARGDRRASDDMDLPPAPPQRSPLRINQDIDYFLRPDDPPPTTVTGNGKSHSNNREETQQKVLGLHTNMLSTSSYPKNPSGTSKMYDSYGNYDAGSAPEIPASSTEDSSSYSTHDTTNTYSDTAHQNRPAPTLRNTPTGLNQYRTATAATSNAANRSHRPSTAISITGQPNIVAAAAAVVAHRHHPQDKEILRKSSYTKNQSGVITPPRSPKDEGHLDSRDKQGENKGIVGAIPFGGGQGREFESPYDTFSSLRRNSLYKNSKFPSTLRNKNLEAAQDTFDQPVTRESSYTHDQPKPDTVYNKTHHFPTTLRKKKSSQQPAQQPVVDTAQPSVETSELVGQVEELSPTQTAPQQGLPTAAAIQPASETVDDRERTTSAPLQPEKGLVNSGYKFPTTLRHKKSEPQPVQSIENVDSSANAQNRYVPMADRTLRGDQRACESSEDTPASIPSRVSEDSDTTGPTDAASDAGDGKKMGLLSKIKRRFSKGSSHRRGPSGGSAKDEGLIEANQRNADMPQSTTMTESNTVQQPTANNGMTQEAQVPANTVDVKMTTAPAITHERIVPSIHETRQEAIERDIVETDVYHYIQPVKDTVVLPTRHYAPSPSASGELVEIPDPGRPGDMQGVVKLSDGPPLGMEDMRRMPDRELVSQRQVTGPDGTVHTESVMRYRDNPVVESEDLGQAQPKMSQQQPQMVHSTTTQDLAADPAIAPAITAMREMHVNSPGPEDTPKDGDVFMSRMSSEQPTSAPVVVDSSTLTQTPQGQRERSHFHSHSVSSDALESRHFTRGQNVVQTGDTSVPYGIKLATREDRGSSLPVSEGQRERSHFHSHSVSSDALESRHFTKGQHVAQTDDTSMSRNMKPATREDRGSSLPISEPVKSEWKHVKEQVQSPVRHSIDTGGKEATPAKGIEQPTQRVGRLSPGTSKLTSQSNPENAPGVAAQRAQKAREAGEVDNGKETADQAPSAAQRASLTVQQAARSVVAAAPSPSTATAQTKAAGSKLLDTLASALPARGNPDSRRGTPHPPGYYPDQAATDFDDTDDSRPSTSASTSDEPLFQEQGYGAIGGNLPGLYGRGAGGSNAGNLGGNG